jgi:MoaA/NifB/PqqE/SkfB family radical SAM enzyme
MGDVSLCLCGAWTKLPPVGNIFQNSLEEIWNSKKAARVRSYFFSERYLQFCNPHKCPFLQDQTLKMREVPDLVTDRHREEILSEKTVLEAPFTRVNLITDRRCNLRCIMCEPAKGDTGPDAGATKKAIEAITPHLSHIKWLAPCVLGEVFVVPELMALLKGPLLAENSVTLYFNTNGILFNEKLWEKIGHNKVGDVTVSIDGMGETYEKIRVGGRWDTLLKNLHFISRLRKKGDLGSAKIAVVVMRDNIEQLEGLVDLTRELGFDRILLQPMSRDYPQNIFFHKDMEALSRLHHLLNKPAFNDPIVDLWGVRKLKGSDWKSFVDTFSEEEERLPARIRAKLAGIVKSKLDLK